MNGQFRFAVVQKTLCFVLLMFNRAIATPTFPTNATSFNIAVISSTITIQHRVMQLFVVGAGIEASDVLVANPAAEIHEYGQREALFLIFV